MGFKNTITRTCRTWYALRAAPCPRRESACAGLRSEAVPGADEFVWERAATAVAWVARACVCCVLCGRAGMHSPSAPGRSWVLAQFFVLQSTPPRSPRVARGCVRPATGLDEAHAFMCAEVRWWALWSALAFCGGRRLRSVWVEVLLCISLSFSLSFYFVLCSYCACAVVRSGPSSSGVHCVPSHLYILVTRFMQHGVWRGVVRGMCRHVVRVGTCTAESSSMRPDAGSK